MRPDSRIVAAAIAYKGTVYSLPPPARHHNIIHHIVETTGEPSVGYNEQGFLDQYGTFLHRKPALMVARQAGQLRTDRPVYDELFSENLW